MRKKYKKLDTGGRLLDNYFRSLEPGKQGAPGAQSSFLDDSEGDAASAEQQASATLQDLEKQKEVKKNRYNNILGQTLLGLGSVINLLPDNLDNQQVIQPQVEFNPNQYGTGSQAIYKKGGEIPKKKALTGLSMTGDPENPPVGTAAPKRLSTQEMNEWNMFQDYVSSKKLAGSKDLDARNKNLGQSLFNEFKKSNPNVSINYDIVPRAQNEFALLQNQNKQFSQRRGEEVPANWNDISKNDGWYGSLTSQQRFIPLKVKNPDGTFTNKGLLNGDGIPTADRAGGGGAAMARRKYSIGDAGVLETTDGRYIGPDGIEIFKAGGELSASKAKEMLKEGTANKKKLTKKQKHYFQAIAHGWKPKGDQGLEMEGNAPNGEIFKFSGPSHEEGGIPIQYMGQQAEVEGGETGFVDREGDLNILGNMYVPGTKKKFKTAGKELMEMEKKNTKLLDKGLSLVNTNKASMNSLDNIKLNTGKIMLEGGLLEKKDINDAKEHLANLQNAMLDMMGPGEKVKFDDGGEIENLLKKYATQYGVDFNVLKKLVIQESNFNPKAVSKAGALGVMQFTPATAKIYGLKPDQLTSDKPQDLEAVVNAGVKHFASLLKSNNNDPALALAAYNGGQGAVDFVKQKLGKKAITGQDWMKFMEDRRKSNPSGKSSAWQNETYDYVSNIVNNSDKDFYDTKGAIFRNKYYSDQPVDIPEFTPFKLTDQPNTTTTTNETTKTPYEYTPNDYTFKTGNTKNPAPYQDPLDIEQVAPEIFSLATNKVEPVPMQKYNPQLFEQYQVSFQDQRNANQATFNAVQKAVGSNPEALSVLAGQKYAADNHVTGEEFRTNQAIFNDITNKNIGLQNDAQLKNLGIADTQMVRQSTARSKTQLQTQMALNSVASKTLQNRYENLDSAFKQMLFKYRPVDKDGDGVFESLDYQGENPTFYGNPTANSDTNAFSRTRETYDKNGQLKQTTVITPSKMEQPVLQQKADKAKFDFSEFENIFKNSPTEMFRKSKKSR